MNQSYKKKFGIKFSKFQKVFDYDFLNFVSQVKL